MVKRLAVGNCNTSLSVDPEPGQFHDPSNSGYFGKFSAGSSRARPREVMENHYFGHTGRARGTRYSRRVACM